MANNSISGPGVLVSRPDPTYYKGRICIHIPDCFNPLNHGGALYYAPPPLPFFLPVTLDYHEAPIPENL